MPDFPTPDDYGPEDYARMGMKSGLEVHQQLATRRKLFCRCPAHVYTNEYHAQVLRHMRPTLSELGEYDGTALMEFKTKKDIIYQIHRSNVCTYELDDAPPFEMSDEALDYAVEISLALGCSIVGEVHVARKQYLDGSIPTGFQRTAIIGVNGSVPFRGRAIGIQQLSIEEDSCREVRDEGHLRVYNTSRLSVPLVEMVTLPQMRTPEEVAAVATELRKVTRGSGRAHTGIGSARQDVNVSVRGGTRIEIKGVPRISLIPALVHYEALRQKSLLDLRDRLLSQGLSPDTFAPRTVELTPLANLVQFGPIKQCAVNGGQLHGVVLPGFAEALNTRVGPGRPFIQEISDQVRVVACLDRLPNLVHHPAPAGQLVPATWARLRTAAGAVEGEALVLVWGAQRDVDTATGEIGDRCRQALVGIPPETRQVNDDGTTGFERVLPGPDRMYPDTDLVPIPLPVDRVEALRAGIPPTAWDQEATLAAAGVHPHQAVELVMDARFPVAVRALELVGGQRVAELLLERWRQVSREGLPVHALSDDDVLGLVARLADGRLVREALPGALRALATGGDLDALAPPTAAQVSAAVDAALAGPAPRTAAAAARRRYYLGRATALLGLRASGVAVADVLFDRLPPVEAP